jgi:hypothetical protein
MVEERLAKAQEDRDSGVLNLVKAAKELENIDIQQAQQVFNLINMVKQYQEQNEQKQDPIALAMQFQNIFSKDTGVTQQPPQQGTMPQEMGAPAMEQPL